MVVTETQKNNFRQVVIALLGEEAWPRLSEVVGIRETTWGPINFPIKFWTNREVCNRITWKDTKQGHGWWERRVRAQEWGFKEKVDPEILSILFQLDQALFGIGEEQIKEEEWL